MKLVAGVMVGTGERDRYLNITVVALLEFCDQVCVVDESTDGSGDLAAGLGATVERAEPGAFFAHEGRARQLLLDIVFEQAPSHALIVDADELVSDGQALRAACESRCPIVSLQMQEIWTVDADGLAIRVDGGWREHPVPVCFQVPDRRDASWRIQERALACGREPVAIRQLVQQQCWEPSGVDLLHLGWSNVAERQARYDRYVAHDGGRFHANSHLQSIMWPDQRVQLTRRPWPSGWSSDLRESLVDRTLARD